MSLIDKLSIRTTDYVAAIDIDAELANNISLTAKGLVCVGNTKLKDFRYIKSARELDESAFDKIIVGDVFDLDEIVKATEHLGYVLVCNLNKLNVAIIRSMLESKGMNEFWEFENGNALMRDVLFRVRKYNAVFY